MVSRLGGTLRVLSINPISKIASFAFRATPLYSGSDRELPAAVPVLKKYGMLENGA